ncbi:paraquat-inducible protein A [Arboricoccus pini]|uniref:Paraquat-inducible protein A n=1 Tax=Arboricoccus pini TaxID=1963835 RepID=A0A212S2I6_9PROT|nr:paraquat-inducible protein A [Arboricoccus pini]
MNNDSISRGPVDQQSQNEGFRLRAKDMKTARMESTGPRRLIACHECGSVHAIAGLPVDRVAHCRTCDSPLTSGKRSEPESLLAIYLAAAVLVVVAHSFPIMGLDIQGKTQTATLVTGPAMLIQQGMWPLGLLVVIVVSVIPSLRILSNILILGPITIGRRPWAGAWLMRLGGSLKPWSMMEIMLLGLIVAYVKLIDLASVQLGLSLYAFVGVILLLLLADLITEPAVIWDKIRARPPLSLAAGQPLLACHACGQVDVAPAGAQHGVACSRCGASLHRRKPNSLARTWALLLAATIFYIPANLLPVMTVTYLGNSEPDTILSGVKSLLAAGMFPVALLVFFASILVPVLKLCGLVWLLLSVQFKSRQRLRQRTKIYRIIEGVGRWSMVDIFMISILVALVELGALARIDPGPGALAFAAVVILTMLGSASFDPKLMWDVEEDGRERTRNWRV